MFNDPEHLQKEDMNYQFETDTGLSGNEEKDHFNVVSSQED